MELLNNKNELLLIAMLVGSSHTASFAQGSLTGPYVGVNGGYSWGKSNTLTSTPYVPGSYFGPNSTSQINQLGSAQLSLNNFIGGAQIGYNYISNGNILFGAEIDFNSLSKSASSTRTQVYNGAPPYAFTLFTETKTNWLLSMRPRIGYSVNKLLIYATGGVALTQLHVSNTFSDNFRFNLPFPSNAIEQAGKKITRAGGIVGAGIEYAVYNNFFVKMEYLYTQFSNVNSNGVLSYNPDYGVLAPNIFYHQADFKTNIARIGINYSCNA